MNYTLWIFKSRLRHCRLKLKLTQFDVAQKIGIAERTYRAYEAGDREPDLNKLTLLSIFFHVSIDFLLGKTDFAYFDDTIFTRRDTIYNIHEIQNSALSPQDLTALINEKEFLLSKEKEYYNNILENMAKHEGTPQESTFLDAAVCANLALPENIKKLPTASQQPK